MLLVNLLKILFCLLIIRHAIKWVSYHWHHRNKKARVFHGNTRMSKELEFALMYGLFAKRNPRFKFKDISYRKTLVQWKLLLNEIYPDDSLYFNRRAHLNLVTPKSPKGDLGVECFSGGKQKQFPFPELKNKNLNSINNTLTSQTHTDLKSPAYTPIKSEGDLGVIVRNKNVTQIKKIYNVFTAKPCAKNKVVVAPFLFNTKIVSLKNLKNSQKPIPFAKQIVACYCQYLRFDFLFILFSIILFFNIIKLPSRQIIK